MGKGRLSVSGQPPKESVRANRVSAVRRERLTALAVRGTLESALCALEGVTK